MQNYDLKLTPEVSRVKKNAKNVIFLWKWVSLRLFLNNDTANQCIFSVIMTTSLTFNTKKQNYADLPEVTYSKNLRNNEIFSKVFAVGMKRGEILQKHPEFLQKTGYF